MFTLGRDLCDKCAQACTDTLLTAEQSHSVKRYYKQWIANLRREDQVLPQVQGLLPLLQRGIGFHHSGLLPLLKEIVEMLFSQGLIKVLFATETFAIGVNMPAKAVCFNGIAKFDGVSRRYFLATEFECVLFIHM